MVAKKALFSIILVILVVVSLSYLANAVSLSGVKKEGMLLLAVAETAEGEYKGQLAKLELEIRPGVGEIFLNTFPSTKLDTQISTRFAKEMACKYADADCNNHDFLYAITSSSTLVGGPSASAAIGVLTVAMLEGLPIDKTVALTGTINSGFLIGPVSGIKEKMEVASKNGIKKVLIPVGTMTYVDKDNSTVDLSIVGEELGIEVVEIGDIDEALFHFTGVSKERGDKVLEVNENYDRIMQKLSSDLCERSNILFEKIEGFELNDGFQVLMDAAVNSTNQAKLEKEQGDHYSSASLCFGANVNLNTLYLSVYEFNFSEVNSQASSIREDQKKLFDFLNENPIETIADLQAYNIVMDRLLEVDENLETLREAIEADQLNKTYYVLAFSTERLYSAYAWSEFYNHQGQKFDFEKGRLKASCLSKIYEAEERYNYVNLFFPNLLKNLREDINSIYKDYEDGNNARCLFRASKTKAKSNIILSTMNLAMEKVDKSVTRKIEAARRSLIDQIEDGTFPIMAYSYYEYAQTLQQRGDQFSALLYLEYALELSNLDIYFSKEVINVGGAVLVSEAEPFDYQIVYNILYGLIGLVCLVLIVLILTKIGKKVLLYKSRFKRTKLKLRND
ncbi:hypothetical protein HN698_00145 [Candidatus Woesearchaeota archaeon]|nr:hypothetical protein [Candidatus Woesearchaeota archaeon]